MTYHGEIKTDNLDPMQEVRALLKEKCQTINEIQIYWFENNEVKMIFEW